MAHDDREAGLTEAEVAALVSKLTFQWSVAGGLAPFRCPATDSEAATLERLAAEWQGLRQERDSLRRRVAELEGENHRLRLGDMSAFDCERLVAWLRDPQRKPPAIAFTAGAVRTAAMAVEESGVLSATGKIMILHEHHGNRYLDVSTPEKKAAACLSVVKGRFGGQSSFYRLQKPTPPEPPNLGLRDNQIEALPDSSPVKRAAKEALFNHLQATRQYERELHEYELIQRCLAENDGRLAEKILARRSSYEDERVEIVSVKDEYVV